MWSILPTGVGWPLPVLPTGYSLNQCLCHLLGSQGRDGHIEDVKVHRAGQQSGSWSDKVQ